MLGSILWAWALLKALALLLPKLHPMHSTPSNSNAVRRFIATAAFVAVVASAPLLRAQIYTELGDAGQTPGTAQNTGFTQPGSGGQFTIFGSILGANDADVYRINLTTPGLFSASTVNALTAASGGAGGLDTQLFLFDSLFRPVMANDDANGLTLQSTLPAGSLFTASLGAGTYYIAISLSGNDPININNQLVFATGLSTSLRGMASGINPASFSDFDSQASFAQTGAYQINIFNVPETGSTLILALGAFGALVVVRRLVVARVPARR